MVLPDVVVKGTEEFQGSLLDEQWREHFLQCANLQEAGSSASVKQHLEVKVRLPGFESQLGYLPQLCDFDTQLAFLLGSFICKMGALRLSTSRGLARSEGKITKHLMCFKPSLVIMIVILPVSLPLLSLFNLSIMFVSSDVHPKTC